MPAQPTHVVTLHPVPLNGRLLDLEDAALALADAVRYLKEGNTPYAVYWCHAGIKQAETAFDHLVSLLTCDEEQPPEDLAAFTWPGRHR